MDAAVTIPFAMPIPGQPPYHLRPFDPAEAARHLALMDALREMVRKARATPPPKDAKS